MPEVLMKILSAAPRCTTLVSPVTIAIPASRAVAAMELTTRSSMLIGSPSSRINPHDSHAGVTPAWLSCGFILEEGLPMSMLERVVNSMAATARDAGIAIVTGDTKVVQRGAADKIFINTSGIGVIPYAVHWGATQIKCGDRIIVSGTLGDHGAAILNVRENLGMELGVVSDCAVLSSLIAPLRAIPGVHALRDATRGGVNAILHEYAAASGLGIEIAEDALPVKPAVRGICELLGLEPLDFANEGKLVVVVSEQAQEVVLSALRAHPLGRDATVVGVVTEV